MSYKTISRLEGFKTPGTEVPFLDPHEVKIVGLDVPETPDNWFAHCARFRDIRDEYLREYAETIAEAGKVDHIIKGYRDGDTIVVLDGRSTTRAARMAHAIQAKKKVPATDRVGIRVNIVKGDPEALYRTNLDSHKHRPLTRGQYARGVLTYYQRVGEDYQRAADFFKTSVPTIKTLLAHFDLSPRAQEKTDRKELPTTATKVLARMPRERQDEAIEKVQAAGITKGPALTRALARASRGEEVRAGEKVHRALPKALLEKWRDGLSQAGFQDLADVVSFVLGGQVPPKIADDEAHLAILREAGYKTGEVGARAKNLRRVA